MSVQGSGFRVESSGFTVAVSGLWSSPWGLGLRVEGGVRHLAEVLEHDRLVLVLPLQQRRNQ